MGGMGKSEIALQYACQYRADYQFVFWIDAETRESLFMSYVKVAATINLLQLPPGVNREEETHKVPLDKLRGDLHDWLRKTGMCPGPFCMSFRRCPGVLPYKILI